MKKTFTILELLIVITLISLLTVAILTLFNPLKQIQKANDSKRKSELATLKKSFEDFYNDKNRFPRGAEICYDSPTTPRTDTYNQTACSCHICGLNSHSPNFSPYLEKLPCDPSYPKKDYLYDFDCSSPNPQWFRIYTNLDQSTSVDNDQATIEVGCYYESCGPDLYGYDYGITSNTDLEKSQKFAYCAISGCNACGDYQSCDNLPIDKFCQGIKRIMPADNCGRENCPCQP